VYKNQIFKEERGDSEIEWEEIVLTSHEEQLAFIEEELNTRAVILFCESDFIEDLVANSITHTYVDMNLSLYGLRNLDEKENGKYRLIVGDNANILSRGIDFRGHNNGLTFI